MEQWIPTIRARWIDEWDDTTEGAFYPVYPVNYDLEAGVSAHVLIIQHELPQVHGILISMYDNAFAQGSVYRFAVLHEGVLSHDDLLDHADRDHLCAIPGMQCQSWFGWDQIHPRVPLPISNGDGIVLSIYRPDFAQPDLAVWDEFPLPDDDGLDLLQRSHQLTHRAKTPISLEELLGAPEDDNVIVRLLPGATIDLLPPWLEMHRHWTSDSIVHELHSWGLLCQVISLEPHDIALCFPQNCNLPNKLWHYAYVNEDVKDQDCVILHSSPVSLDVKEHMKFLHSRGYPKAVAQSQLFHQVGICVVRFLLSHGQVDSSHVKGKRPSAWPEQQSVCQHNEVLHQPLPTPILHHTDCLLRSPVTFDEVSALLISARDVLCTSFEGLDLPDTCAQAFHWCGHGLPSCVDRLLIYTDGSSPGGSRLTVPESTTHGECQFDTWAFLVVGETYEPGPNQPKFHLVGWNAQPVLYNPESTQHLFADRLGSDVAEREALFFAGLWRLGLPSSVPTIFRPDSLSTCLQAEGSWGTASPGPAYRALRGVFQALKALLPGDQLQFAHVTSHVGEPFNDFVDFAAKSERIKSYYHQRQPIDLHKWAPVLPYLWMFLDKNAGLPPLHIHGFSAEVPDLPGPSTTVLEDSQISATLDLPLEWDCSLKLATANVGSLSSGPGGHGGKLDYLRQQFVAHRLHFLGVQESRAPACSSHIDGVYRLASGSQAGHFGVELWINTTLPFASCGTERLCFRPKDFTVALSTPRFLLTRLECDFFQAWILVAHAPQSGRALSDRESWWQDLSDQIQTHHTGLPLLMLIDANASAGGGDGVHVFSHDTVSANTRFFRDFIEQFDLCLPSTGPHHHGSDITWRSPDGEIEKRIDYVAIPTSWSSRCLASFVLPQFDLGHLYDHQAVQLDLAWKTFHCLPPQAKPVPQYDRRGIKQPVVQDHLGHLSVPDWHCDIESHVHAQNQQYHQVLQTHCKPARNTAKKPFLDATIWDLRKQKLAAKKQMHKAGSLLNKDLLHACFKLWISTREPDSSEHSIASYYAHTLRCKRLGWGVKLHLKALELKQALKQAKHRSLVAAIEDLPMHASSADVLQVVKLHQGSTNLSKLKPKALPQVKDGHGSICQTKRASLDRWIEFFMHMEGGERLTSHQQRETWRQHLEQLRTEQFDESLLSMPTLTDVELALRRVAKNKATGPDGLPGELCRFHPAVVARHLYAQVLKLALHGQEALVHKGGFLSFLYKGKGDSQECSAYRSILVSSHLGKCLHRTLRSQQQGLYEAFLQKQQIGGRRCVPVSLGVHIIRGFLRIQKSRKRSAGICFLDLKEAFYRIVRPLAVNVSMTDDDIAAMLARLGLPASVFDDLRHLLCEPSAIQQAGLPWYAQKYVSALHLDTHFSLHGQDDQCRTTIGSRPGDSFADVVFGYTFARVLQSLESQLYERGLLDTFAQHDRLSPFVPSVGKDPTPLLGAVWMDDLAICLSARSAQGLESRIGQATSCLLDLCTQFGMTPNLAKGKTELLLSFVGPGSRTFRTKYHGPNHGQCLPVVCEHGVQQIAVVQEYVHLGNVVHMNGHGKPELRRRIGIGQQAFNSHRRLLFQNPHLSRALRCRLFDTLVLSKVLYSTEVWHLTDNASINYFHSAVMRLYPDCTVGCSGFLQMPIWVMKPFYMTWNCQLPICSCVGSASDTLWLWSGVVKSPLGAYCTKMRVGLNWFDRTFFGCMRNWLGHHLCLTRWSILTDGFSSLTHTLATGRNWWTEQCAMMFCRRPMRTISLKPTGPSIKPFLAQPIPCPFRLRSHRLM